MYGICLWPRVLFCDFEARISYFENSLANRSESWTSSKILFCPMTLDSINEEISNNRMVGFVMLLYRRAGFNIYNGGIDNTVLVMPWPT